MSEDLEKCESEIRQTEEWQAKVFDGAFRETQSKLIFCGSLVFILLGLGGAISVLEYGLRIESFVLIVIGGLCLWKANQRDKTREFCRIEYARASQKLETLRERRDKLLSAPAREQLRKSLR